MHEVPENCEESDEADSSRLSSMARRRYLSAVGTAGLAGVAGVGSGAMTGTVDARRDVDDGRLVTHMGAFPEDAQFNEYNNNSYAENAVDLVFDRLARYDSTADEFVPSLLTDWTFDGDSLTVEIRKDATWHDGDPVTSLDVAILFDLDHLTGRDLLVDTVTTDGDRRAVIELVETTNQRLAEHEILRRPLTTKHTEYRDFLAAGDDGADQLHSYAATEPVGNGPFQFADRNEDRLRLNRFEEHPRAEAVAIEGYDFKYFGSQETIYRALHDGELDASVEEIAPGSLGDELDDFTVEVEHPAEWGMGLVFDHDHEHFGRRAVRRAMMHVIDTAAVADAVSVTLENDAEQAVTLPTGLRPIDQERVLGDAESSFQTYDNEAAAESLLRDAGYSREDGTWTDESGDPLSVPITTSGGWSDWMAAVESIESQLSSFGFDVTTINSDSLIQDLMEGNYTVATDAWLPNDDNAAIPYRTLECTMETQFTRSYGYLDRNVSVPAREDGGTLNVSVSDRLEALRSAADPAAARAIATELAWVVNQDLPMLPIITRTRRTFVSTRDLNAPAEGDDAYGVERPVSWLVRTGNIEPNGNSSGSGSDTSTETATPTATEESTPTETDTPTDSSTATPDESDDTETAPTPTESASASPTETKTTDGESGSDSEDDSDGFSLLDLVRALF